LQSIRRLCVDAHVCTKEHEDLGHPAGTGMPYSDVSEVLVMNGAALGAGDMLIDASPLPREL
jgi:hypothetical protein